MENVVTQLTKIRADSIYGKKKHFNASDRKNRYNKIVGILLIILNIISGSVLLYVVTEKDNSINLIPLILSLIAAFLSSFQTFFNFSKQVEGHRSIGNSYLSIMKKCEMLISLYNDKIIEKENLATKALELLDEVNQVNKDAESFPTSGKDYKLAQRGIEGGEEAYTKNDLSLWGETWRI